MDRLQRRLRFVQRSPPSPVKLQAGNQVQPQRNQLRELEVSRQSLDQAHLFL